MEHLAQVHVCILLKRFTGNSLYKYDANDLAPTPLHREREREREREGERERETEEGESAGAIERERERERERKYLSDKTQPIRHNQMGPRLLLYVVSGCLVSNENCSCLPNKACCCFQLG